MVSNYYDTESERCLIAAMLADEESLIETCATMQTEDFYEPRHQAMYDILNSLFTKAIKPTYLEMLKEGHKRGTLSSLEDREYAKQTIGYHVSTTNLPFWFKNVKDKAKLRKLRSIMLQISGDIKNPAVDTDKLIQDASRDISELTTSNTEQIDTGADLVRIGKQVIEERMNHKGELSGISTGIGKLNRLTSGWKGGDFAILAAESGKGKTAFAQNFIAAGCFIHEAGTLYANSEMSKQQVILRFASMVSGVDAELVKFGEITEAQKLSIFANMEVIEKAPFYHYPCPSLNINNLVSMIRKLHVQKGIKLVFVDYIGRMDRIDKDLSEWQEFFLICKTLKTLAGQLSIAIIVLAQLNEDGSLQVAKKMRNECDILIKLLPMSEEDRVEASNRGYKVDPDYWVFLDKNRDGQGEVMIPVKFDKSKMQVVDVANA
jgi:replicative DNA helicase